MRTRTLGVMALVAAACGAGSVRGGDVEINTEKAIAIRLPEAGETAVKFKTDDGKEGWVKTISREALPTLAYGNGKVYSGGGFSSRTFMAMDAGTGKTIWSKGTQDNGPTSAVVSGKRVAYNTESCHTEVRDSDSGELVWSEVTGGTLLTQPLIADNVLVIPHPTMARASAHADDGFRMLGLDLKTLKHSWNASMTGDVLSAPVARNRQLFFTCTDGRLFQMNAETGDSNWHVVAKATSAPVVVGSVVAVTTEDKGMVGIQRYNAADGSLQDEKPLAMTKVSGSQQQAETRAGWDYQGPKIACANKVMFNAPGNVINAVGVVDGKTQWTATVKGGGLSNAAGTLTPPAVGSELLFVGTKAGHVLGIKQKDASVVYSYSIGAGLATQPILAGGSIYFGTTNGRVVCIHLKEKDAEGWYAWGGNEGHNKVD